MRALLRAMLAWLNSEPYRGRHAPPPLDLDVYGS